MGLKPDPKDYDSKKSHDTLCLISNFYTSPQLMNPFFNVLGPLQQVHRMANPEETPKATQDEQCNQRRNRSAGDAGLLTQGLQRVFQLSQRGTGEAEDLSPQRQ